MRQARINTVGGLALASLFALALLSLLACGTETGTETEAATPSPAAASLSESEIQALEALGYVDHATVDENAQESGVVARTPACECDGYLLVTYPPMRRVELLDRDGQVIRTWKNLVDKTWERATFTLEGDVLVVGHETLFEGDEKKEHNQRLLTRFDFDGNLLWRRPHPVHHLARARPDGRVATLSSRPRNLPKLPEAFGPHTKADNGVALMTPDGSEFVDERSIYEALASRPDLFQFRVAMTDGKPSADFLHANYFEWMPGGDLAAENSLYDAGNVIVTLRKQDTVAIFDFDRGELLWAWGQGEVIGLHDAKVVPSGNVLLFDNRSRTSAEDGDGWSRVVEVDPRSNEIVWEYRTDPPEAFYSHSRGTVHRLSGGNTLIASSNQGRIFEVTREGEIAWDFWTPNYFGKKTRTVLRVEPYDREFVDALLGQP